MDSGLAVSRERRQRGGAPPVSRGKERRINLESYIIAMDRISTWPQGEAYGWTSDLFASVFDITLVRVFCLNVSPAPGGG